MYHQDWGLSELLAAMVEIMHDSGLAQNISHLTSEASVSVFKIGGFRDAISGEAGPDDVTPEMYADSINRNKSNFKSVFINESDSFERTAVNLTGFSDLMDRFGRRLAAMADIPETRFFGRSPAGMNATGDSDMQNYALHVAAMQARFQRSYGDRLDEIFARMAGTDEPPESEWPMLTEMSDKDRVEITRIAVEALHQAWADQIIDEDYYAERLSRYDEVFGNVPPPPEPEPEPEIEPGMNPFAPAGETDGPEPEPAEGDGET